MISISKIAQVTGHKGSIFALLDQGDGHFLSAGGDGWIVRWELADLDPGRLIARVESNVFSIWQRDETIVTGDMHGGMHWIDTKTSDVLSFLHHRKGIFQIWNQGEYVFAISGDGYISRRSFDDPESVESVQISQEALRCQVTIDDDTWAIGSSDGCIYIVDSQDLTVLRTIEGAHENSVFTLVYDPEEQLLWSGGRDAQIKVWNVEGQPVHTIPAHLFTVNALAFNKDRSLLFSGSRDKSIKIWDARTFELIKVIEGLRDDGHLNSVNSLIWCSEQECLISGSDDKSIGIWKIEKATNDIIG